MSSRTRKPRYLPGHMPMMERSTATLREPRKLEVMVQRPGRVVLEVAKAGDLSSIEVDDRCLSVGAHPSNEVTVVDDAVSSLHCELELEDDGAMLRDLGSKNGTWVDGCRVKELWLPLHRSFTVGHTTLTLKSVDEVEVPVSTVGRFGQLYGRGPKMGELFAQLNRIAAAHLDLLCIGETGTGKELIARGIHEQSDRRDGPFVIVDCTLLSQGLAESILFGHRKGSFTDASRDHAGLLEQADGGTLFLDEVGELPLALQPQLLRALEQKETRRIGDTQYRTFDARVIAATNRNLPHLVVEKSFRDDLYFRLAVMTLRVPPLRERGSGNIALLADLFLERCTKEHGTPLRFDKSAYTKLRDNPWKGNVRQLYNLIRTASMMSKSDHIRADDLHMLEEAFTAETPSAPFKESDLERIAESFGLHWTKARKAFGALYASHVLMENDGNQTRAAQQAGLSRSAFRALLNP